MLSHIINGVLFVALVLTAVRVGAMYRELKRLRAMQEQYRSVFDRTTTALGSIRSAVGEINREGTRTLAALDARIGEARRLLLEIEMWAAVTDAVRPDAPGGERRKIPGRVDRAAA
jgi:hypothetical protein